MQTPELITIDDKTYKVADLSNAAKKLANDITIIQNEITHNQVQIGIFEISKNVLLEKLKQETSSLEEVPQTKE
jgi:hypothetical protein